MLTSPPGIGADYPLSAVICSEFAPRQHRARMLASVFSCQPIGQLLGMIVSLVAVTASRKYIPTDSEICTTDECIRALDSAWRWIVGFGSIPAVIALFFRLTIPESPRYLLDVVGAVKGASMNTQDYYKGDAFGQSQELMEAGEQSQVPVFIEQQIPKSSIEVTPSAQVPLAPLPSPTVAHINDEITHNPSGAVIIHTHSFPSSVHSADEVAIPNEQQPSKASWQDANQFFITEKNWMSLVATSSSWFCLDVSHTSIFELQVNQKLIWTVRVLWPRPFRPRHLP